MILELDFLVEPLDGRTLAVTLLAPPQRLAGVDVIFRFGCLDFGHFGPTTSVPSGSIS